MIREGRVNPNHTGEPVFQPVALCFIIDEIASLTGHNRIVASNNSHTKKVLTSL